MSSKQHRHSNHRECAKQSSPQPVTQNTNTVAPQQTDPGVLVQIVKLDPRLLTPRNVLQLQRAIGNQAVGRLLARTPQHQFAKKEDWVHSTDIMGEKAAGALHETKQPLYREGTLNKSTAYEQAHVPVVQSTTPVIQRMTALQTFNNLLRNIAPEVGQQLGKILGELSENNTLEEDNAEQRDAFAAAWKGAEKDKTESGDDRVMLENLIQSNWYGIGDALKRYRLQSDKDRYLKAEQAATDKAFRDALFFRAERKDSAASTKGYLQYDKAKHGKKGSASVMPGKNQEQVAERAEGYLFVSKNRVEARDYAQKAQGGEREVLNIIASRNEVSLMQYDVDSGGYKTRSTLTGIVDNMMTDDAIENLNTWLPKDGKVAKSDALDQQLMGFLQ